LKDIDTHKTAQETSSGKKKVKDRGMMALDHMSLMVDQFNPADPFNE
jgi:hypothetical protein